MNAQVHQPPELEVVVRLTLPAAQIVLDGLAKLPIERASGLYAGLQNAIDDAIARQRAPQGQAPAPPPAPPDNNPQPPESQPT